MEVGSIVASIKADITDFKSGMKTVKNETSALGNVGSKLSGIGSDILDFTKKSILAVSAASVAGSVFAVKSASDFEQSRVGFETMLGSAEKAKSLMTDIAKFAKETPFELPDVVKGSQRLLAFGYAQDEVIPKFKILGDIALGNKDKMESLVGMLGKVKAKGRADLEALNIAMDAGVPIISSLAKHFKTTEANIFEMVSTGKVGLKDVEDTMGEMTSSGGMFFNAMKNQSLTFDGVVSNVKDTIGSLARTIVGIGDDGEVKKGGMFFYLKEGATFLYTWLSDHRAEIESFFGNIIKTIGDVVKAVAEFTKSEIVPWVQNSLMPVLREMWNIFQTYILPAIKNIWKVIIEELFPAFVRMWQVLGPILIPILKVLAVILGVALYVSIIAIYKAVTFLFNAITWLITGISNFVKGVIDGVKAIHQWFLDLPGKIAEFLTNLPNTIAFWIGRSMRIMYDLVLAGINGVIWFFTDLPVQIYNWLLKVPERVSNAGKSAYNSAVDFGKGIWNGIMDFINGIPNAVTNAFNSAVDSIKNLIPKAAKSAGDFASGLWNSFKNGLGIHSPSYIEKALFAIEDQAEVTGKNLNGSVDELRKQANNLPNVSVSGDMVNSQPVQLFIDASNKGVFVGSELAYDNFAEGMVKKAERVFNAKGLSLITKKV
ncbi:MAG: tape measure protein [Proteobacteria bacterium]|jgi:hypothetical protein|nr:tape measure protein [Pseudomonadota bacterium]